MRSVPGQGRLVEIHHLFTMYVGEPLSWWTGPDLQAYVCED
jgi:hypothetical protein